MLKEVGWVDTDGDGILEKDGKHFEFTVILNQGNNERRKTAEIIQRRLADVGIKIKIRTLEWATFINEYIDKKNFDATILGWTIGQDPDLFDVWHSSKTHYKELNFISYKNEEVDRLIMEGRHTFDLEKRKTGLLPDSRNISGRSTLCLSLCSLRASDYPQKIPGH